LLFVMPIPLLAAGALIVAADITVCGISVCTRAELDIGGAMTTLVVAVLILAIPCTLVRWHPRPLFRLGISLVGAIILVGGSFYILRAIQ